MFYFILTAFIIAVLMFGLSNALWIAGFLIFLAVFVPIFLGLLPIVIAVLVIMVFMRRKKGTEYTYKFTFGNGNAGNNYDNFDKEKFYEYYKQNGYRETNADNISKSYEVLGVEKTANEEEIKKAYKVMARKYHPDFHHDKNEDEKKNLEAKFKEINSAYDTIKKSKNF